MADSAETIGAVQITIGADLTDLQTGFDQATTGAQNAGQSIASAFTASVTGIADFDAALKQAVSTSTDAASSIEAVGTAASGSVEDVAGLGDALRSTGASADGAASSTSGFGDAVESAGSAAAGATPDVEGLGGAAEQAGAASGEATSGLGELVAAGLELGGIVIGVEALKDLATEAIESYTNVQQATIAITQLTGSAQEATGIIEGLRDVALSDALSFPNLVSAEQRMIAFGFSVQTIPAALQAAADAAAATGKGFDSVTAAMDRMSLSGTASARMLASLGLSMNDLASVMGVDVSQVAAAFKAMDPSDRLVVIEEAMGKFDGAAAAMATSIAGEWQNLKTQTDFALEGIGAALAPLADVVLPAAATAVNTFASAWSAAMQVLSTVGTAVASVGSWLHDELLVPIQQQIEQVPLAKSVWNTFISTIEQYNTYALVAAGIKGIANEITTLTGGFDGLNGTIVAATQHFNSMATVFAGGKAASDAWGASVNLAALAAAGLGDQIPPVTAAMQRAVTAATNASDTYNTATAAYNALKAAYESGQTVLNGVVVTADAVAAAHTAMASAAKAAGVNLQNMAAIAKDSQAAINMLGGSTGDLQRFIQMLDAEYNVNTTSTALAMMAASTFGIQMMTTASQIQAVENVSHNFGIQIMQQPSELQVLGQALSDAQGKLTAAASAYDTGTGSAKAYLKAQQEVTNAQQAFDVALAESNANWSGGTDAVSLYTSILAGAKAKLNDVTQAYLNQQATAQQLLSAQKAVTSAQNELNTAMGKGTASVGTTTGAVGALNTTMAATPSLASSVVTAFNSIGAAAVSAAAGVNSLGAAIDAATSGASMGSSGAMPSGFSASVSADDPAITGQTINGQFYPIWGRGWAAGKFVGSKALGIYGPDNPPPAVMTSTASSTTAGATTATTAGGIDNSPIVVTPINTTGTTTGISTTTATVAGAVGTAVTTSGATLIDEDSSGTLYGQLSDIANLLGGASGTSASTAASIASMATATASTDAATIAAADLSASATTASTAATAALTGTLMTLPTAVQQLAAAATTLAATAGKSALSTPVSLSGVPTVISTTVTGGGGTSGLGSVITLGQPTTGASGSSYNFNFANANFAGSGVTPQSVQLAVTQALRTAGARF